MFQVPALMGLGIVFSMDRQGTEAHSQVAGFSCEAILLRLSFCMSSALPFHHSTCLFWSVGLGVVSMPGMCVL